MATLSIAFRFGIAKRIVITESGLQIGNADIPLTALGKAELINPADEFAERGAKLDARAFLALKGGLPQLVKIEIVDKSDPTPYLLISTRKADELIKALKS